MPKRIVELDSLRGLGAVAVMLFHYPGPYLVSQAHWNPGWIPVPLPYGFMAVQLFFMISGFVIFFSLEKSKKPVEFVIARFSRLFPAYWCAIALSCIVGEVFGLKGWNYSLHEILVNFTMLHRFFLIRSIDPPHWYLTFELMFYSIIYLLLLSRVINKIELFCGIWLLIQSASLIPVYYYDYAFSARVKGALLLEFANLLIAGMMFYRIKFRGDSSFRWMIILLCLLVQCGITPDTRAIIVGFFFFTFVLLIKGFLSFLACRPLLFLGSISYSIYLIHNNFGHMIMQKLYLHGVDLRVAILIAVLCVIVMSTLLTKYIEKPAMKKIRYSLTELFS